MLGEQRIKEALHQALRSSPADQTEAVILAEDSYLTRFANSYIHQNVAERNCLLLVRAIFGRRIGVASTNSLEPSEVKRTVAQACRIAKIQRENKDFKTLPAPRPGDGGKLKLYFPETANFSARQRAEIVSRICRLAEKNKSQAFGALSNGTTEMAVANSLGVMRYQAASDAYLNTVVMSDTGSGYGQGAHRQIAKIDFDAIARKAVGKAVQSRRPEALQPGRYTVVLEETAVFTLLEFLNYTGFSARALQEGRSFMGGKFGQRIVDPRVTVIDDPGDAEGFAFPFDFEGVTKQKLPLIEQGVAKNVVYDSLTAGKDNRESTGHALMAPAYHPLAGNLVLKPGQASLKKLVEDTDRGVYVTRFHYVNLIDPMEVSITGMTRDGTFLIENGRITKPVKNLRFTVSVLECLNNLSAIGHKLTLVSENGGYGPRFASGFRVPALKLEKFNFTGTTDF